MASINCEPNDTISLFYYATDRSETLYPQAKLYDTAGNLVTTVNLTHTVNGLYQGTYTPDGTYKHLVAHYIPYSDSGHTTAADYASFGDDIYVQYSSRPGGFGSQTATLDASEVDKIVKLILEKIDDKLKSEEILEELRKKSEFDPKKDKVQTDIKIPATNLREIKDKLDEIKKTADEVVKNKTSNYSLEFVKLAKELKTAKLDLAREVNSIKGGFSGISKILNKQKTIYPKPIDEDIVDEIKAIQKALPNLEKMLEALNKEDFKRIATIVDELKKINQFLKVLASTIINNKLNQEDNDFSEITDLLRSKAQK